MKLSFYFYFGHSTNLGKESLHGYEFIFCFLRLRRLQTLGIFSHESGGASPGL